MFLKELSSGEIKEIELQILVEFARFCEDNQLTYYLSYGTLLGAIRHKGFIPWDDDIDVIMPRPDYEKFISMFKSKRSNIVLKSNYLGNMNAPFTKVVDKNTIVKSNATDDDIDTNLWVDVFPVDGLPENKSDIDSVYKKAKFYRVLLMSGLCKLGHGRTKFRKYIKYLLKPISYVLGKKYCIDNIEKIAQEYKFENSKYVGMVTWSLYDGARGVLLKSEFEQSTEVEFEGYKFKAMACWDKYLASIYGDYMQLPPMEKRMTHNMIAYLKQESAS